MIGMCKVCFPLVVAQFIVPNTKPTQNYLSKNEYLCLLFANIREWGKRWVKIKWDYVPMILDTHCNILSFEVFPSFDLPPRPNTKPVSNSPFKQNQILM